MATHIVMKLRPRCKLHCVLVKHFFKLKKTHLLKYLEPKKEISSKETRLKDIKPRRYSHAEKSITDVKS